MKLILAAAEGTVDGVDTLIHKEGKMRLDLVEKALDAEFVEEIHPFLAKKEGRTITSPVISVGAICRPVSAHCMTLYSEENVT